MIEKKQLTLDEGIKFKFLFISFDILFFIHWWHGILEPGL